MESMAGKGNTVAAIVVTYNRKELLLECIHALLGQTEKSFDILIIDNASTDGTFESIESLIDGNKVQYYNTGKNIGGAGGFHFGLKKAYENGYDYFWLMDDDTVPKETALSELLNADKILHGEYGFLSSFVEWIDGSACAMNVPRKSENNTRPDLLKYKIEPIKTATFVSFFTHRTMVKQIGLPIKEFFIWCDDINYCNRISKVAQGYWVLKSGVVHKMKNNAESNLVFDNSDRLARYVYEYRNRFYNARMEHELNDYFWHVFKRCGRIIITAKDRRILRLYYMLKGFLLGFSFHPEIEYADEVPDCSNPC